MANPFKKTLNNAKKTEKKWERNEVSKTKTLTCPNCGAARPKDTNLTTCDYCGYKFMQIKEKIKTDK